MDHHFEICDNCLNQLCCWVGIGDAVFLAESGVGGREYLPGRHCPQILADVPYDQGFHVFARGKDQAIWTRRYYGLAWTRNWESLGKRFQALGGNILSILHSSSSWAEGLKVMKHPIEDPVATCRSTITIQSGPMSSFVVRWGDTRRVLHTWFDLDKPICYRDRGWVNTLGGNAASMPVVVCCEANIRHDVAIYNRDGGSVQHNQWQDDVSGARVSFFGTGTDGAIYHLRWTGTAGYTPLENLGGQFQSGSSVVTQSSGRIDVVALGADNKLEHQGLIRGTWSSGWEDIGRDVAAANSAPQPVRYGTEPIRVVIFVIGADDDLFFSTWNVTQDKELGQPLCV
ncbi:hypothetical protein DL769_001067 [Monosporascus sp. CRB-8-3]|nr:hypothetical protein DL769_001067 [Monosporascus sp. CRB-8-3]